MQCEYESVVGVFSLYVVVVEPSFIIKLEDIGTYADFEMLISIGKRSYVL